MKKVLLFAGVIAVVFTACKKGEKDPFFSLLSRKARLSSEWTIQSWTEQSSILDLDQNGDTLSDQDALYTIDGDSIHYTVDLGSTFGQVSESGLVNTATWVIRKDGTWRKEIDYKIHFSSGTKSEQTKTILTGTWNFLGKVDSFKNKERVIFDILTRDVDFTETFTSIPPATTTNSYTYNYGENTEVYNIVELRNGQVELTIDMEESHIETSPTSETDPLHTTRKATYILSK